MSSQSFADLGASSAVAEALAAEGITTAFPSSSLVIPDALAGATCSSSPRPARARRSPSRSRSSSSSSAGDPRPSALVLAPTRELAGQIVEELRPLAHARALSVAAVYGGAGIERQIKLARRAHILVATPGRLEDLIARRAVSLDHVRILVLDEADRMLDMGFRPAVDRIVARIPRERQTLFFSATLEGVVGRVADEYTQQRPPPRARARSPSGRGDVQHRFVAVTRDAKLDALVSELRDDDRGLTLVFVRTKRGADRLVKRLRARDIEALAMHGNKSQAPAREGARALRRRPCGHAGGDRRRRARPRHRRHHPRDQLRRARRTATATCTASAAPAAPVAQGPASPSWRTRTRWTCGRSHTVSGCTPSSSRPAWAASAAGAMRTAAPERPGTAPAETGRGGGRRSRSRRGRSSAR